MSLLDSLGGGQGAGGVMGMIGGLINQAGGVQGLINTLQQGGLGNAVQSWVSSGANQAINSGQLQQALAGTPMGAHVEQMAQKMGVDPSQVLGQLAQHLPTAIDHVTPNGQVPDAEAGLSALQGLAAKLGL
ncbi:MAG: DUF937 domain-containing protein [Proteobacteria bacterium]|nr:DUF937 domain-containing protein [Pseudomonadota bacterium]